MADIIDFQAARLRHFMKLAAAHGLIIETAKGPKGTVYVLREVDTGLIDSRASDLRIIEEALLGLQAIREMEAAEGYY